MDLPRHVALAAFQDRLEIGSEMAAHVRHHMAAGHQFERQSRGQRDDVGRVGVLRRVAPIDLLSVHEVVQFGHGIQTAERLQHFLAALPAAVAHVAAQEPQREGHFGFVLELAGSIELLIHGGQFGGIQSERIDLPLGAQSIQKKIANRFLLVNTSGTEERLDVALESFESTAQFKDVDGLAENVHREVERGRPGKVRLLREDDVALHTGGCKEK